MSLNTTKILISSLLLHNSAAFLHKKLNDGHCSIKRGDVQVEAIDANMFTGHWINVYGRKEINEDWKCFGVEFEQMYSEEIESDKEKIRKQKIFDFNQNVMKLD